MLVVDTNHWVYLLDARAPEHARVAPALKALLDEEPLLMSGVIQLEVAHFVVRQLSDRIEQVLEEFFDLPLGGYEAVTASSVLGAMGIMHRRRQAGIGSRDAHILYTARRHGASLLLTDDRALAKAARAEGIAVRNLAAR